MILCRLIIAAAEASTTQTPSKFWPEGYEMLFGIPASMLIFFLPVEVRRSDSQEGDGGTHREGPRQSSMPVRRIEPLPKPRRHRSVRPRATSKPSGPACWPRPTRRPPHCSKMVAPGSHQELAELESPGRRRSSLAAREPLVATSCAPRSPDSRRPPSTTSVTGSLDEATQQATDRELHRRVVRGQEQESTTMSDSRIEGYARGLFEIARAEGTIDEVEDELFRFARSLREQRRAAQRAQRRADPGQPSARRSSRISSAARSHRRRRS